MHKRYVGRQSWKTTRRRRFNLIPIVVTFIGVMAVAAFALILILSNVRQFAVVVLVAGLGLGAIACWVIVGYVGWRWFRMRTVDNNRVSVQSLNAALPVAGVESKAAGPGVGQPNGLIPAASLTPAQFEEEVAWVLGNWFGLRAEVVGRSNDGGIDVKLYDTGGTLISIIQAKRYHENAALNPSFLRDLDSVKRRMGVANAYLVTTARFSEAVQQQAEEMHIYLVDGQLLESWRQKVYAMHRP